MDKNHTSDNSNINLNGQGVNGYVCSGRKSGGKDSVIHVGKAVFGGNNFDVIAGPCSVESEEQIFAVASAVSQLGIKVLRGGAFKPRTSPYSFQGLEEEGIKLLLQVKKHFDLAICTEITAISQLDMFKDVDVIQVGARNMQNYELLKELGKTDKTILLKRGISATLNEWLSSAEYVMSGGNSNVILCERGIRTFEPDTRNTLDLSAIPLLKERTHLPVIVDPSHACGISRLVMPMSLASVGAGSDGLIIEVHPNPKEALSDGQQSITPIQLEDVISKVKTVLPLVGKVMV